jgi:lipid II:glycine glycyltransferase (peptidoglycan interpeptide bridge formation enzyme)
LHTFPDEFRVFVVNDQSRITALSVVVRVRDDILYNFLPASHPDYSTFSPMVMLIGGLFTYCQHQGIPLLDLGVSLDGTGQPKPSLIHFKRNLGAQVSPKLTFEKSL